MNRMKMFFNYLFFRDMGNLGEGVSYKRIHLAYDHACHYWGLLLILKIIS